MQAKVQTVVLLIGVTGTTYQKYALDPLVQNLGLDHDRAKRLLLKLHATVLSMPQGSGISGPVLPTSTQVECTTTTPFSLVGAGCMACA
jgi:hypothetical protein